LGEEYQGVFAFEMFDVVVSIEFDPGAIGNDAGTWAHGNEGVSANFFSTDDAFEESCRRGTII
jgi:hypothetical protein